MNNIFEHTTNNIYIVNKELTIIDNYVNDVMKELGGDYKYSEFVNYDTYEVILSRYITKLYLDEYKQIKDGEYVVIKISINNKNYNITIGNIDDKITYGISHNDR